MENQKMKPLKIKDVMSKEVVTITDDCAMEKISRLLIKHDISGVPVVNKEDKLIGIVSEKDLFRVIYPNFRDIVHSLRSWLLSRSRIAENFERKKNTPAGKMMTHKVITASPEDSLIKIGALMFVHNLHRFPVIDKAKRVVGIVTRRDIFRKLLNTGIHAQR